MIHNNRQSSLPGSVWLLSGFTLLIITGLLVTQVYEHPYVLSLRFNGYSLLSLASVLANLTVLGYLSRLKSKTEASIWFGFFVLCATLLGSGEALQRLSATPAGALFWAQFSLIGIILAPLALFCFTSSHAGNLRVKLQLIPLFIICAAVVIFFNANGGLIYSVAPTTIHLYPWGFNDDIGPAFILHVLWICVLYGASVVILLKTYATTQERLLKRQSGLFAVAVGIPWILATITDATLPLFGITFVPMAVSSITITGILILIGFKKYALFKIDRELLSESILATMREAVIVTRPDFQIDLINTEAELALKASKETLYQQNLRDYFTAEDWEEIRTNHISGLKTDGEDNGYQTELQSSNTPVRVTASPLEDIGGIAGYVFVIADISELAASLDQLASEKRNVEKIVEVRTQALRKAHEDLKAADQLKSEFLILASHNLRTPLTSLMLGIDLLRSKDPVKMSHEEVVGILDDNAKRLSSLVESMLTISQLQAGDQLELKPAPVLDVFNPLVAEARESAHVKGLKFLAEMSIPPATAINCNVLRLQSSLRNLLDNALKFTKTGSIVLKVTLQEGEVVISVTDTGIGISAEEIPKLFTSFHRGTDTMHFSYQGQGIGLYYTKLVIEEHGGTIDVMSKLGKGTAVTVTLPVIQQ